jgi:hypothetical protein
MRRGLTPGDTPWCLAKKVSFPYLDRIIESETRTRLIKAGDNYVGLTSLEGEDGIAVLSLTLPHPFPP